MARRHPPRPGAVPALAGIRRGCAACPAVTSKSRLFCPRCWTRLAAAPGGLRERLRTADGADPLLRGGKAWLADVEAAKAFLARGRQDAVAGEAR